jgi:hypothetical protein
MEEKPRTGRRHAGAVPRALPAIWAIVTVGYLLVAGYRAFESGHLPGLPSAAGMAAVATVWLEIVDRIHATAITGLMVTLALWLTLVTNGWVAGGMYRNTGNVPVFRVLLSILFAYLLIAKLLQLRHFGRQQEGNGP